MEASWIGAAAHRAIGDATEFTSQCTLDVGASSATGAGTNLTVNRGAELLLHVHRDEKRVHAGAGRRRQPEFGLSEPGNLDAERDYGGTGSGIGDTPNSGIGTGPQTFTYLYSDSCRLLQNIYLVQEMLNQHWR